MATRKTQQPEAVTDEQQVTTQLVTATFREIVVPVIGTAPLVTHNWDAKVRGGIIDVAPPKGGGPAPRTKKPPKDPDAEFQAARYLLPDGSDGFPATGFKSAITQGARAFDKNQVTMAGLKAAIRVSGEGPDALVRLRLDGPPINWQSNPRIGQGKVDVRYRPKYWPWGADLHIEYVEQLVSRDVLLALIEFGGRGGIGEWRPNSPKSYTGHLGTFQVDKSRPIFEV